MRPIDWRPVSRRRWWASLGITFAVSLALGVGTSLGATALWGGAWGLAALPVQILLGYGCGCTWAGYLYRHHLGVWPPLHFYVEAFRSAGRLLLGREVRGAFRHTHGDLRARDGRTDQPDDRGISGNREDLDG